METLELPWAFGVFNRCSAVKEPSRNGIPYYGRCELQKNHTDTDHAIERGMFILRWSTEWTQTGACDG
jgi:hypothetical protein